jgi:replicative DNA helicase
MIRKYYVQKGIKFVVVDYVGRMNKLDKELKEWQVLENICKTLKTLAQELKISIMVLAQLNDDQKLQAAKRMENESDIFIKLLPMTPEDLTEAKTKGYKKDPNYWVLLSKNREGQGEVKIPVLFRKEILQVVDVA